MINELMVTYSGYARKTTTQPRYQYDIGQVLVFNADFPSVFEVHLQSGESKVKVIANDKRALLPDSLLEVGENIRGWMYLPTSESANTLFEFEIPVIKRPQGEEVTPTPQEQGIIEQAIELINSKLADLSSAVTRAEQAAERAEEAAEGASGGSITQEVDPTVPQWAKEPTKPTYTAVEVGALPSDTPIPTVPSKVSALENDKGYITNLVDDLANYYLKSETHTKDEVAQLLTTIKQFKYEVVTELPTASADTINKIYLVPSEIQAEQNIKDEFITIESGGAYAWEQIGSTAIDLSDYVKNTDLAIPGGTAGIVQIDYSDQSGLMLTNPYKKLRLNVAELADIKAARSNSRKPIIPSNAYQAVFYGLAKAAGDTTQAVSDNAVGVYTDEAKAAIQSMLGIDDLIGDIETALTALDTGGGVL